MDCGGLHVLTNRTVYLNYKIQYQMFSVVTQHKKCHSERRQLLHTTIHTRDRRVDSLVV